MHRTGTGDTDRESGAVVVELALVVPLLVGLFLGVVTTGLAFFARLQMTSAAQEGARVLYLGGSTGQASAAASAASAGTVAVSGGCATAGDTGSTRTVTLTRSMPIRYLVGTTTVTVTARAVTRCP